MWWTWLFVVQWAPWAVCCVCSCLHIRRRQCCAAVTGICYVYVSKCVPFSITRIALSASTWLFSFYSSLDFWFNMPQFVYFWLISKTHLFAIELSGSLCFIKLSNNKKGYKRPCHCVYRWLDFWWRQSPSWDLERLLLAQLLIWPERHIFCNVNLVFKRVSIQVHMFDSFFLIFSQHDSRVGFCSLGYDIAEDWLNPDAVLEAFEARALRMAVTCAKNLSKFENQEQGTLLTPLIQSNWSPKGPNSTKFFSQIPPICRILWALGWAGWGRNRSLSIDSCFQVSCFFFFFFFFTGSNKLVILSPGFGQLCLG